MGICQTTKNKNQDTTLTPNSIGSKTLEKKTINPKCIIKDKNNETIIRTINDIKGDAIIIDNCNDCTIIILDVSAQVIIEKCYNSSIFIGPCNSR